MCQFKSMLVFKDRIYWDKKKDSHSDMLEDLKIADDSCFPNFVRIEVTPKDGDIFNHDIKNWKVNVDQDFRPDWFYLEDYEPRIMEQMQKIFSECFVIDDQNWSEYKDTKIYVKNSKIKCLNSSVVARGNSSVVAWENSSVVARGNSSVVAWENSSVEAWENSSVVARGNSSVVAWENSSVEARENSSVVARGNNIKLNGLHDNATIKDLSSSKPKIYIANKNFEIVKFENKSEE